MSRNTKNVGLGYAALTALSISLFPFSGAGAIAAGASLPAESNAENAPRHVMAKFVLYGQIDRALMFADDGFDDAIMFVDNDNSSSRFGITVKVPLTNWLTAGGKYETEIELNSSARVTLQNHTADPKINLRNLEAWVEAQLTEDVKFRMTLGQGSSASDGTSERDLSGTKVIGYSGIAAGGSAIRFRNSGTMAVTGFRVGKVFNNLDGFSRVERLRGDLTIGAVKIAASIIDPGRDRYDVAAFVNHTFADTVKILAAISHGEDMQTAGANFSQTSGSVSVLHIPTGVSLTGASGVRNSEVVGRDNRNFYYGKLAITRGFFPEIGDTSIGADFFHTENALTNNDEGDSYGIFAVQKIDDYKAEIFVLYRQFDYMRVGTPTSDVQVFMTGARFKFKT